MELKTDSFTVDIISNAVSQLMNRWSLDALWHNHDEIGIYQLEVAVADVNSSSDTALGLKGRKLGLDIPLYDFLDLLLKAVFLFLLNRRLRLTNSFE